MPRRRAHRSEKLCEFQVKKPTGRIAPTWNSDPSTRQYTGSRRSTAVAVRTPAGRSESRVEGDRFSLMLVRHPHQPRTECDIHIAGHNAHSAPAPCGPV